MSPNVNSTQYNQINSHLLIPNFYEPDSPLHRLYHGGIPLKTTNEEPMSPLPSPLPLVSADEDIFCVDLGLSTVRHLSHATATCTDVEYVMGSDYNRKKQAACENGCKQNAFVVESKLICGGCNIVISNNYSLEAEIQIPLNFSLDDTLKEQLPLSDNECNDEDQCSDVTEACSSSECLSIFSGGESFVVSDESDDEAFADKCISRGYGHSQRVAFRLSTPLPGIAKNIRKLRRGKKRRHVVSSMLNAETSIGVAKLIASGTQNGRLPSPCIKPHE